MTVKTDWPAFLYWLAVETSADDWPPWCTLEQSCETVISRIRREREERQRKGVAA